mgnify:CR=1 FL=1
MPKPVIIVFLILVATTAIPIIADTVWLGWRDSGYDLAAGYRYSIGLQSGRVWTGATALAAVSAGPLKIELRGSHLKIVINDNAVFDEDVGEESVVVSIIVDCDGSGRVEVSGFGMVGGFSIDHSYRIMVYTETVNVWPQTVTSRVTISRQPMNCIVSNPTLTPVQENPELQVAYNPLFASIAAAFSNAGMIALVVLLLGFVAIALIVVFKQARKRKWI